MSFKAILKLADTEFTVLKCYYGLSQETDATGRPSSVTRGGMITLVVESTASTLLSDWMFNNFETKSGSICFLRRDNNAVAKELFFTDAYAVKYLEWFHHRGRQPMKIRITLSAREIQVGYGIHTNAWV